MYGKVREDVRTIITTLCKYTVTFEDFTLVDLTSEDKTYFSWENRGREENLREREVILCLTMTRRKN